jgi:hypothetical protein
MVSNTKGCIVLGVATGLQDKYKVLTSSASQTSWKRIAREDERGGPGTMAAIKCG